MGSSVRPVRDSSESDLPPPFAPSFSPSSRICYLRCSINRSGKMWVSLTPGVSLPWTGSQGIIYSSSGRLEVECGRGVGKPVEE